VKAQDRYLPYFKTKARYPTNYMPL